MRGGKDAHGTWVALLSSSPGVVFPITCGFFIVDRLPARHHHQCESKVGLGCGWGCPVRRTSLWRVSCPSQGTSSVPVLGERADSDIAVKPLILSQSPIEKDCAHCPAVRLLEGSRTGVVQGWEDGGFQGSFGSFRNCLCLTSQSRRGAQDQSLCLGCHL